VTDRCDMACVWQVAAKNAKGTRKRKKSEFSKHQCERLAAALEETGLQQALSTNVQIEPGGHGLQVQRPAQLTTTPRAQLTETPRCTHARTRTQRLCGTAGS
jgi:hypothetical protein